MRLKIRKENHSVYYSPIVSLDNSATRIIRKVFWKEFAVQNKKVLIPPVWVKTFVLI